MPVLDDALYDAIEGELNKGLEGAYRYDWHVKNIRVDREAQNQEAWIHIKFRGVFDPGIMGGGNFTTDIDKDPEPEKYPEYEGILTWENCD